MSDVFETIEYRGHTIETGFEQYDLNIFDPRRYNDGNVGVMHCAHRHYDLGDEQTDPDDMMVPCRVCVQDCERDTDRTGMVPVPTTDERREYSYGHFDPSWVSCPVCDGYGEVSDPVRWAIEQGATVVLGLYLYDHSGISMSASTLYRDGERQNGGNPFSCRWDSGMVGIMFDTPEGVRSAMGKHEYIDGKHEYIDGKYTFTGDWHTDDNLPPNSEWIEKALHSEVRVYDDYLTGQIMWYRVKGPTGDDSCGGFFPDEKGDHGHMIEEAKASIDSGIVWAWQKGIDEVVEQQKISRVMAL